MRVFEECHIADQLRLEDFETTAWQLAVREGSQGQPGPKGDPGRWTMAIDTRDKRASILGLVLAANTVLRASSGAAASTAARRAQLVGCYSGQPSGEVAVPEPPPLEIVYGIRDLRPPPLVRLVVEGECQVQARPPTVHGEGRVDRPVVYLEVLHGAVAESARFAGRSSTYADLAREVLRLQKLLAYERAISGRVAKEWRKS